MNAQRPRRSSAIGFVVAVTAMTVLGCARCGGSAGPVAARFEGGTVTVEELRREAARLPPVLRARFETPAGQRDLANALIDKRLLAQEARRRKLHEDPEVRRQVEDLEEKLAVQALLAEEERRAGPPAEAELRAAFQDSPADHTQPARVQLRRILAEVAPGASPSAQQAARQRAERLANRLKAGEAPAKVAADGDGPERGAGGDLGLLVEGRDQDAAQAKAVAALTASGQWSPVVRTAQGYALLQLLERRPGRVMTFEESRAEIGNRLAPQRQRKRFDELLARLRTGAQVRLELPDGGLGAGAGEAR